MLNAVLDVRIPARECTLARPGVAMDACLQLAQAVLRIIRRPLTSKAILDAAYRAGIVPHHLYGQTQEKTLQARLSEHIIQHRENGRFFRTQPGFFFLTELLPDPRIPEEYKSAFSARRRTRDVFRGPALAIKRSFLNKQSQELLGDWKKLFVAAQKSDAMRYVDADYPRERFVLVWTFPLVRRGKELLAYRVGKYRDSRDHFARKKSIGFPAMISYDDRTFFSSDEVGASDCALKALLADLNISFNMLSACSELRAPTIIFPLWSHVERSLLLVMDWRCPDWFEPTRRRLSLNDLHWIDRLPNDIEDFEPWSVATMKLLQQTNFSSRQF